MTFAVENDIKTHLIHPSFHNGGTFTIWYLIFSTSDVLRVQNGAGWKSLHDHSHGLEANTLLICLSLKQLRYRTRDIFLYELFNGP